ncbi:hypothetical protein, partial [Nesterenkonia haasae]|uniref:hypothetical protein n=1 Tax=Nesterenkonia haasae TaxID=2587813 RepID=UPI00192F05D3
ANEDASTTASADADSASEAAAQAAATADADSEAAADASAAADPDADAAASAAATADASADASGTADGDEATDPSVTVEPDSVQAGDEVEISGEGFVPGSTVTVVITDADGNVVGTIEGVDVEQDGTFAVTWTVPEDTEPGDLTVTATDDSDSDITDSATLSVVVGADATGESTDSDGLARTGVGTMWLVVGLSLLLLLAGTTALVAKKRAKAAV